MSGHRRAATIVAAAGAIAAGAVMGGAATAAQSQRLNAVRDVSANWSGYAVTSAGGTAFTDVTGTWTVPAATCVTGTSSAAAVWVGLGGYTIGSQQLEQVGTDSDCSFTGTPTYYVWYELVPEPAVTLKLKVSPGDVVTGVVLVKGTDVLLQVKNRTRKTTFSRHLQMTNADLSSAEWIAEAPSECSAFGFCRVVTLTNFGSVTFSRIAAIGDNQGGTITANPGWSTSTIQLVPQSRRFFGDAPGSAPTGAAGAGATPTGLTPDGASFSVNYTPNATAPTG